MILHLAKWIVISVVCMPLVLFCLGILLFALEFFARRAWATLLVIVLFGSCAVAQSQPPTVVPMTHEGRPGLWLEREHAREVLAVVEAEPHMRERIELLERDRELGARVETELRAALSASQDQTRLYTRARRRIRLRAGLLAAGALVVGAGVGALVSR